MFLVSDLSAGELADLLTRFALRIEHVPDDTTIPGSFWGENEAGLIGDRLYVRNTTPVHSALHEACHFICMDERRRNQLHRDAGGDHAEENAVCYLQILFADYLSGTNRARMCADMDAWGYTFRLGSANDWFTRDADDARIWLQQNGLLNESKHITWRLRF